jgi:hypothetical protein
VVDLEDGCELEPITLQIVVVARNAMTSKAVALRKDLRAWIKSPAIRLSDYSADPVVRHRVGSMIANFDARLSPHAISALVARSVKIRPPDKL